MIYLVSEIYTENKIQQKKLRFGNKYFIFDANLRAPANEFRFKRAGY